MAGKGLPKQLSLGLMGAGGLAVLAGLWLLWSGMSDSDAGPTDNAARESIDQIGNTIDQVSQALGQPAVADAARAVLSEPEADVEALRRQLQSAGVANLLDVRVFGPNVEDIEVGEYPQPDFSVIQMLLDARDQGSAPVQVHYPGTANENLAFARALRERAAEGEQPPAVGYLFVRLPVSVVTRRLAQPGAEGWLALQQGDTEIASNGRLAADRVPDGQATIAGSRLRLNWTTGGGTSGSSPMIAAAVVGVGVLLLGAGVLAGRAHAPAASETSEPEPAGEAVADADAGEDRQNLPEWMLDEPAGDTADEAIASRAEGAGAAPEPGSKRSGADLPFDVPDLDEIYEKLDADEGGESKAHEAGSSGASSDEDLLSDEDFDFTEDSVDPDEDSLPQPSESFEAVEGGDSPVSEQTGTNDEVSGTDTATEDKGLDLDFAFSAAPGGDDETDLEALLDSADESVADGESASEPPTGEGLELALEDEQLTENLESGEDEDEDVFVMENEAAPAESKPEPEPESRSADAPETTPPTAEMVDSQADSPAAAESGDLSALPNGIFRPGDILGVVDEDLTARAATDIGQGIGTLVAERGFSRVVVARDGRFSGPILLSALIRGLRNSGVDVIEIGAVPTPLLWFAAAELADGCGVMVTGSHHPPKYNGFRIMIGGELLDRAGMVDLARRVERDDFAKGEGEYEQQDILQRYAQRLTSDVQLERPLKVVVDCGNGVGGAVVPKLLQAIGADLIPLYCDVDGAFPNHRPDPSSPDDLEDLRLCVRNFQAELGIAFDGDADRLALVTKNGEIVWPDRLMMLLAENILKSRPGEAVVFDVRSSGHLQSMVEHAGGRGVMTATGQQSVARRLREENAPLGGDMNGHLFINDRWYSFDDAIHAAARLLELLAADSREVDEILAGQPQFRSSPEIVVNVEREQALSLVDRLSGELELGDALLTRIDGVRADWSDRWGLARVDADTGCLILRFGADEATALGRVRSEFRDKLLELEPKLPLPY